MRMPNGKDVYMAELTVGAIISAGAGRLTSVYGFSHSSRHTLHRFVTLHTANGTLSATSLHHIHTGRGALPAGNVRVGDALRMESGEFAPVLRVGTRYARGLYNPHTLTGTVVVNGFIASAYTDHMNQQAAQALLTPFRALHTISKNIDLLAWVLDAGLYKAAQPWVA